MNEGMSKPPPPPIPNLTSIVERLKDHSQQLALIDESLRADLECIASEVGRLISFWEPVSEPERPIRV